MGGTSRPQNVPGYLDVDMYKSNFACYSTRIGSRKTAAEKLRQMFVCVMRDIGTFYGPLAESNALTNFCKQGAYSSHLFGGPWPADEYRRLNACKKEGDIVRGDGYDVDEAEYVPEMQNESVENETSDVDVSPEVSEFEDSECIADQDASSEYSSGSDALTGSDHCEVSVLESMGTSFNRPRAPKGQELSGNRTTRSGKVFSNR